MTPKQLTELRHRRGWTQRQAGERFGVGAMTISRWERGATPIHPIAAQLYRYIVAWKSS